MARIAGKQRRVLELRAFERCSYADIAISEGIRVGTVRSRISRGRKAVQKHLEEMEVHPMLSVCKQCGWRETAEYQLDRCPSCDGEMTSPEGEEPKGRQGFICTAAPGR